MQKAISSSFRFALRAFVPLAVLGSIGAVVSSTLMTLVVLPALYLLLGGFKRSSRELASA